MPNLTNSEVIECILRALASKIGRRTSETFAIATIDKILKELKPKYDFLKCIRIQDTTYSKGMDAVSIIPDIDSVKPNVFYKALNDIIKSVVKYLKGKTDLFFIKEFQEALDYNVNLKMKQEGIDLNLMEFEYTIDRKQTLKTDNSEVMENVIRVLTCLLNRVFPEKQAIGSMINIVKKLGGEYDFLKYIEITDNEDSKGSIIIKVWPDIDTVFSTKMAEAIEKLIWEVNASVEWDAEESFIECFKNDLGEEQLSKIEKMSVNLDHIQTALLQKNHEKLVKKSLDALVAVVGRMTSEGFAIVAVDKAIKKLEGMHDVLRYIKIDESRYTEGAVAIDVIHEINNVESYKLAKTLREIIKMTGRSLGDESTASFIEEFKRQLGKEYLYEIEKIGINLHLLELKFT